MLVRNFLLMFSILALPISGSASTSKIIQMGDSNFAGQVEFPNEYKAALLKGSVFIQVYQDAQTKELIAEKKLNKELGEKGPLLFLLDANLIKTQGRKWKKPFFIRAVFKGKEYYSNDEYFGPIEKPSFLLGPLQGGERKLRLLID